ncbi:CMRF35-like molecule 9 isoform X1 [Lepus europaeus]|uniref:CMRF35-like molecule 9 isoform X1 n=1 Tax=Lepus europaeus TaxID=9983 RepID=UPI002B45DDDE|nr:CMRF35-like molecule 9 isoform X1 [Lepus europaeus]
MQLLVLLWGCLVLPGLGALQGPKEISGFEGDTVSLRCTYDEEQQELPKYWCREAGFLLSRCSNTVYAAQDGQETTVGRVSVRDSPQERVLTVTLRNLTLQDAGMYWCGAKRLGFHKTFSVKLLVFQGPCCPLSPTASSQPLVTWSLQPKAKSWPTQPPDPTSAGLQPTLTTAKQGNTGAKASPMAGTSPCGHTAAAPYPGTSPPAGTAAPARSSTPAVQLHAPSAEDTTSAPSSGSSQLRVSIPTVRMLAPFLVLLTLLVAAGLITVGSHLLPWRKEAQLATETEKSKGTQVCLSALAPEEETAPSQAPEGHMIPAPALRKSEEEVALSKFISG